MNKVTILKIGNAVYSLCFCLKEHDKPSFAWMQSALNTKFQVNIPEVQYNLIYVDETTKDKLKPNK